MSNHPTHTNLYEAAAAVIPQSGYIRRFKLANALDVHVTTVDRWVRTNKIPAPVKLGEKATAFDAVEIHRWLAKRRGEVA